MMKIENPCFVAVLMNH